MTTLRQTVASGQALALRREALQTLPGGISAPRYDVSTVRAGIVHLGLGGFHRAHMARYTHDLMEDDAEALQWGIVGAVLLPTDERIVESLRPQDGLYTLIEREGDNESLRVIGSLAGVVFAGESSAELLRLLDDPAIRILSLTVTENGYCLDPATKRLNPSHDLVHGDLMSPEQPRSAIGVIVEAFRRRRRIGVPPFTVLSCDNIQANGAVLREAVLAHARLRDSTGELAGWIEKEVSFPSTMVDRITPVTDLADIERLAARGLADRWPVVSETFSQWVIEDRFPQGRPAWERVGAQFVEDVEPYEFMKLRLLNTSHLAVSGLGRLAGYETIDAAMADRRIAAVMTAIMDRETGPTVPPVPGIDINVYKQTLVRRFSNPAIRDTVDRVNADAPLNVLLDPIRSRIEANAPLDLLALALAAWLRRVRGEDECGRAISVRHPLGALLRARAIEGGPDPTPLLSIKQLFGNLGQEPQLVHPVQHWLSRLYTAGIEATLDEAGRRAEG